MPLDQATQQALVAALLSDDDNDNMGIEAFTDDEDVLRLSSFMWVE